MTYTIRSSDGRMIIALAYLFIGALFGVCVWVAGRGVHQGRAFLMAAFFTLAWPGVLLSFLAGLIVRRWLGTR